jgi:membrane-bound serine protease (ClpP class)
VITNDGDLISALRTTQPPVRLDLNFMEKAVLWLTSWPVRGALFVIMMVLAWIEFSHPGISVAGIGALICLILLVGAPYMTGLAQAWELLLIIIGVLIIILDLVISGGLGMFAIPGFILMAIGLIASFVPAEPGSGWSPTPKQIAGLQVGFSVVIFGSCIALGSFFLMARYLYLTPGFRKLQLAPAGTKPPETTVTDDAEQSAGDAVFIGALGKAASDLRPAGKARFGPHLIDVVTQGQFVDAGGVVEVADIRGNIVTVRPAKPAPDPRAS